MYFRIAMKIAGDLVAVPFYWNNLQRNDRNAFKNCSAIRNKLKFQNDSNLEPP